MRIDGMHDIRVIREHPDAFDRGLARRGLPAESKRLIGLDERRRELIQTIEAKRAERNAISRAIGQAKAKNDEATVLALRREAEIIRFTMEGEEGWQDQERQVSQELATALASIPNLPRDDVPDGKDASDNVEHHHFGAKPHFAFSPKQHFELGEVLAQMDFQVAAKLSGARFVVLKTGLARLERALGQFMLDIHTGEHGYTEITPPLLVRDDIMYGTAQLPKFEEDQFPTGPSEHRQKFLGRLINDAIQYRYGDEIEDEDTRAIEISVDDLFRASEAMSKSDLLWLIPTAEVPLTNLVRESILDEAQLPLRYTACTPCFRAEAGAAGRDTRGMIRQHQFTKVELVSITTPEQSKDEHERMLACAEEVLKRLDLHYRVMTLSTGDMGFAAQKTYDIEVWLPGQNAYREISSCSVCGDFQARRMNARYRTKEGRQVRHVHTLNGSGVAVGRALIAVMETYQQDDGSIVVPEALAPYMGGMKKIEKQ
jgi:seryl-tRNA synthetase